MTVAIVGAGLGGLLLSRVLHVNGIDAVVYERESSRGARGQGGMLDLHSGTGQRALREAGLIDQFHAIARAEGQDLRLLEPDGTLLLQEDTPEDAPLERPEVDRADLRNLLLDSLPEHVVRWGHAFESAKDGTLHFANGSSSTYDLLVGADGADSARFSPTPARRTPVRTSSSSVFPTSTAPIPTSRRWLGAATTGCSATDNPCQRSGTATAAYASTSASTTPPRAGSPPAGSHSTTQQPPGYG